MILVCNSIRNDLLHPNEYIRGRTLRLLSRVMYKGILEPLTPSILENLTHKHTYVRRNAVSCLFSIYCSFKDELIPDVDEHIEKLLIPESDLSTKRTAFLLLFNANQDKAFNYLNDLIGGERGDEMGDIMQLIVLELLRFFFF
jgi:coatomer subunit beta